MAKTLDLLDKSIPPRKIILFLAWPTIVEQILQTLVQYVDTAMVGSLGATATAAVAVGTSSIWLINGVMNAVAIGFAVQIARYIGAGELDRVKRIMTQAVLAIAVGGLFFTGLMELIAPHLPHWLGAETAVVPLATSYLRWFGSAYLFNMAMVVCSNVLRCSGNTKTPLFFNAITNVLNVVGNFLLIFPTREITVFGSTFTMWGAGLGVSGAAISTAASFAFSGLALLGAVYFRESPIRIPIRSSYRPDKHVLREVARLGTPNALERMTLSFGQIAMTALVTGIGTTALAAHHLAITAESISYLPCFGFSAAATTLVAQALGAGETELATRYGRLCTIYGTVLMTVAGALMFIFARGLMSIFTGEAAVLDLGAGVLRIEALAEPFFALSMVIPGVLRGAGDTKWPFYISVIGMWGVRLISAYILAYPLGLGLTGAWIGMVLDLVVRGILSVIRFAAGKWKNAWTSSKNAKSA